MKNGNPKNGPHSWIDCFFFRFFPFFEKYPKFLRLKIIVKNANLAFHKNFQYRFSSFSPRFVARAKIEKYKISEKSSFNSNQKLKKKTQMWSEKPKTFCKSCWKLLKLEQIRLVTFFFQGQIFLKTLLLLVFLVGLQIAILGS